MDAGLMTGLLIAGLALVILGKSAVIVPQQSAYVVEQLGKYTRTLHSGFTLLIPFIEQIAYRHTLKEEAMDVAEQICITNDNVQVGVDGVLYMQVIDPKLASYGIGNYRFAITQLAQTTLRSQIGAIVLDKTFEERQSINLAVVFELDKASQAWGVKVLRYEIRKIEPPTDVLRAMEKQMRAEREKRATVLQSEGDRDARINEAEGVKQQTIKDSEGQKQRQINEAEGQAKAILAIADATGQGLERVAKALTSDGADKAMDLRVAEQYLEKFGQLAKTGTTMIVPATLTDLSSMLAAATTVVTRTAAKPE